MTDLIKFHICAWETRADGIRVNCSLKHSCTNCCIVPIYARIVLWLIHETKVEQIYVKCLYKCSFVNCIECDRFLRMLWMTYRICSASFINEAQKHEHIFFITRNCTNVFTYIVVKCDHTGFFLWLISVLLMIDESQLHLIISNLLWTWCEWSLKASTILISNCLQSVAPKLSQLSHTKCFPEETYC